VLFVANARGVLRPSVEAALEVGAPVTVYGAGWDEWLPSGEVTVAGHAVANDALGALYASAGVVLNDHWEDMRTAGFVSNRVFDVLATGSRLLSDDVAGLHDVFGTAVPTWRSPDDFRRLTTGSFEDQYPDADARASLAEQVLAEHSFDARARHLLDSAQRLRARSVDSGP
jgi:spore maturation protein CgeB